jgi:hypothetical protein
MKEVNLALSQIKHMRILHIKLLLLLWSIGLGDCKIQSCVFQHFLIFFIVSILNFLVRKFHIHEILNIFRVNRVFKASQTFFYYFQKFKHAFFECPLYLKRIVALAL